MNNRLSEFYTNIENQNNSKFLNNEIEINKVWGTPIWGVTLQIDLGVEVKDQLCRYQEQLDQLEPNNLLLLPRGYQHISFNQVVFWGGEYEKGTQRTWESISGEFMNAFSDLDRQFGSFPVTFSQLIPTTGGIIWCGYDENDEMEKLRDIFLNKLPFPKETTKYNHIIHATVARYKNKLNNPQLVLDYIAKHQESIKMRVASITLKNELVFPSIKTINLGSIELV